jgi:hypothetical protein
MERIQESRLKILERWHSPYKRRSEVNLDQWKALCIMSDVINDLLTRVIEKEPVDWRRSLRHHQGTLRLCSYQKALYSRR